MARKRTTSPDPELDFSWEEAAFTERDVDFGDDDPPPKAKKPAGEDEDTVAEPRTRSRRPAAGTSASRGTVRRRRPEAEDSEAVDSTPAASPAVDRASVDRVSAEDEERPARRPTTRGRSRRPVADSADFVDAVETPVAREPVSREPVSRDSVSRDSGAREEELDRPRGRRPRVERDEVAPAPAARGGSRPSESRPSASRPAEDSDSDFGAGLDDGPASRGATGRRSEARVSEDRPMETRASEARSSETRSVEGDSSAATEGDAPRGRRGRGRDDGRSGGFRRGYRAEGEAAGAEAGGEARPASPARRSTRAAEESDDFVSERLDFDADDSVRDTISTGGSLNDSESDEGGEDRPEGEGSSDRGSNDEFTRRRRRRRRRSRRGGQDGPVSGGGGVSSNQGGSGSVSSGTSGGSTTGGYRSQNQGQGGPRGPRPQRQGGHTGGGHSGGYQQGGYQQRGQNRRGGSGFQQGGGHQPRPTDRRDDYYDDRPGDDHSGMAVEILEGILELHPKGYGFLRSPKNSYIGTKDDPFVPASMIDKFKLREGVMILGEVAPGHRQQGPRLKTIQTVEGRTLEEYALIRPFDELTAINPTEQIHLETPGGSISMRVMDLLTPIGKGQRALIVAPPRTGKTMLLQQIAEAVTTNHPEVHLIVLLIDERPEEVTEMKRRVKGEVIASSMDREVESHVRLSQLIFERAKRMAERGRDVFVLLDSITRTARAFNKWVANSGRTGSGGLDVRAMDIPKKMFGTARQFDEGGSLTVAGTALIETNSRMDDVIFEEFKGTGNMELVLNRSLADRRIWPAIDITKSGTRREELILSPETLEGVTMLRRSLISQSPVEAMDQLTRALGRFPKNSDFLAKIRSVM